MTNAKTPKNASEKELIDLKLLYTFCEVARCKGIRAAANKLGISESSIHDRLRRLQEALRLHEGLYDRLHLEKTRKFRLTAAGERLLPQAERLVESWRGIYQDVGAPNAPRVLRIGAIESVLHSWLIDWLEVVQQDDSKPTQNDKPTVTLELTIGTTDELTLLFQRGRLDVIFSAQPVDDAQASHRVLAPMPMAFVGSRNHHRPESYSLLRILKEGQGLITFQRGSLPYESLVKRLQKDGLRRGSNRHRVHAVSSISAMQQLVANGFGVATLPQGLAEATGSHGELFTLKCDHTLEPLPIHAMWRPLDVSDRIVDEAAAMATRWSEANPAALPA